MRFDLRAGRLVRIPGPQARWHIRQGILLIDRHFLPVVQPAAKAAAAAATAAVPTSSLVPPFVVPNDPHQTGRCSSSSSSFIPSVTISNRAAPTLLPAGLGLDWRFVVGVNGTLHALSSLKGLMATFKVNVDARPPTQPQPQPGQGPTRTPAAAPAPGPLSASAAASSSSSSFRLSDGPVQLRTSGGRTQKNFMWLPLPGREADPLYVFSFAPLVVIRCPLATGVCSDVIRERPAESRLPPSARHWRGSSSFVPLPSADGPTATAPPASGSGANEMKFLGLVHSRVFHARYEHRFVLLSVRVPDVHARTHSEPHAHVPAAAAPSSPPAAAAAAASSVFDLPAASVRLSSVDWSSLSSSSIRVLGASDPFDLMAASAPLPASLGGALQVTFGMSLHLEDRAQHPDCGKLVLAFGRDDGQSWAIVMPVTMAINTIRMFNKSKH